MRRFFIPLCIFLFFSGCNRHTSFQTTALREDLFTLEIGLMEDQIALFNLTGDRGIRRCNMTMRDSLLYISDGTGAKIKKYNSYGDLLFMIYNAETNPPPLTLRTLQEGSLATRWAVSYPLNQPGEIAVDSRKHIYVRDSLPPANHGFDPESRALLDNVILHFDESGRFIEYLGKNGPGGSPFPRVENLFTSVQNELIVVCRLPVGWEVYWFRSDGALLYMLQLRSDAVPVPQGEGKLIPSLDSIAASPDERLLYVKVDYYRETLDESTGIRTGTEYDSSYIWIMNIETGSWEDMVEIPYFEYSFIENNRRIFFRIPYSVLGVINGGRVILSIPEEDGYSLLFLGNGNNGRNTHGFIEVDNEELRYNVIDISPEGIVSGLLLDDWQIKLVWWRTDRIINEGS